MVPPEQRNPLLQYYGKPIHPFLEDPDVTEICINGASNIYVERGGRLHLTDARFENDAQLEEFVRQIAHHLRQDIDGDTHPILDARLEDGSRVNAILPPYSVGYVAVTIRPSPKHRMSLDDLLRLHMLDERIARRVEQAIADGDSVMTAGGTGSGKTTLLRAFTQFIPRDERVLIVEDTTEGLAPGHPHAVQLEAARRRRHADDQLTVTMDALITNTLRMRGDKIIVGEVRTPEAAAALFAARNTGHSVPLSTVHANSARDTFLRLRHLLAAANPSIPIAVHDETVRSNLRLVLHVRKVRVGDEVRRRVTELIETREGEIREVLRYDADADTWH
ncbi:pilus assembly protein CpaF [Inquilinus ginsengisoli]|uniref:Pilus assembly protein CpaF n=1 Tax=Inquilinus ginsengisoli TaxID=363840 RepID=A0ABU1K1T5_9PROT|nr:ATPase, T2SS/T4P/T4SS family [Inquilinus ginsengisoli]MDR6293790.1 pilus assembly protein CpaF [Inquilinus ginsengisoli]